MRFTIKEGIVDDLTGYDRKPNRVWPILIVSALISVNLYAAEKAVDDSPKEAKTPFASMEELVFRYRIDRDSLAKFYGNRLLSKTHRDRLTEFYNQWQQNLDLMDFEKLPQAGKVDYVLMRHQLEYRGNKLATDWRKLDEIAALSGFREDVITLYQSHRKREKMNPRAGAEKLAEIEKSVKQLTKKIALKDDNSAEKKKPDSKPVEKLITTPVLAQRTERVVGDVQGRLEKWYRFYAGFDPDFSWWAKEPYEKLSQSLKDYRKKLDKLASDEKKGDDAPLVGDPLGESALADDLTVEMLAYSAEELLEIGEREFAWCRAEMKKASAEMGHGDNWRKALEEVKRDFVPPGRQDELAAKIAEEAIQFVDDRGLVTVPELCRETWYLTMLGKKEQQTLPYAVYFGQAIGIAFPTNDMSVEKKLMSLRGNNRHFTRTVIPHELIPGHHLQRFIAQRYARHRSIFRTPFYVEGWALHWEMLLYDLNYPQTPEERIGMLFWRSHRCARIIVTLKFHLGEMKPEEMVDFLVEDVGLEPSGARGEVRRYVGDAYSPLYQCGYMIGGLQLRAIYKELVDSGKMTPLEFHDQVLKLGPIPIDMIRASFLNRKLTPNYKATWKF